MKLRQARRQVDPLGSRRRDPRWATALVVGSVAVATLAITRSAADVPVVVASVLIALGVRREDVGQ